MADTQNWNNSLLESQQQAFEFWNNWLKQAGEFTEAAVQGSMPDGAIPDISEGMDEWWKAVSAGMTGDAQAVFPKVLDAARNYLGASDSLWQVLENLSQSQGEWTQAVNTAMEQFRNQMTAALPASGDAWSGFADSWGLDADVWNKFASSDALGGFNPAMNPLSLLVGPGTEAYQKMFQTPLPPQGVPVDWAQKLETWNELAKAYGMAAHEYGRLLQEANGDAISILGDALVHTGADNAPDNLRAMYDLWVDSGEAAYAKLATEDRFVKAQSEQMNALLRLKQHEQEMGDDYLKMFNIPSRRELDNALKSLQETRRELRQNREALEESQSESAKQTKALKAEATKARKAGDAKVARLQAKMDKDAADLKAQTDAAMEELRAENQAAQDKLAQDHAVEMKSVQDKLQAMGAELETARREKMAAEKALDSAKAKTAEAAAKPVAPKKAPVKKTAAKKPAVKKAAAKKPTAKKAAPKKAVAPKPAVAKKVASSPKPAAKAASKAAPKIEKDD